MVRQEIEDRQNYYYGQLLKEDDFLAEQEYHIRARQRHNRTMHGTGIVSGLEVDASGDSAVAIAPGFAVADDGREIIVRERAILDLSKCAERDVLTITLSYTDEKPRGENDKRITYAVVSAIRQGEPVSGLALAVVRLDDRAKVRADAIDRSARKYAGLPPGSVTVTALEPRLQTGWLKMPFRPMPLDHDPEDKREPAPPFRVGATEARSHTRLNGTENKLGAGGTMGIPIPSGVRRILRLRIAGENNSEGIELRLVVGGWDKEKKQHVRRNLVDARRDNNTHIEPTKAGPDGKTPYLQEFAVEDGEIDPEYSTLSLWLRGFGRTSVSLIAVQYAL